MFRSLLRRVAVCAVSAAAFTAVILVGTSVPTTVSSGAVSVPSAPAGPAHVPKYVWPTAHGNPQLTGVSGDPTISDTNAGQLGVRWMSNLTAQSLTSPVVAYNQALGQTLVYAGSEGRMVQRVQRGHREDGVVGQPGQRRPRDADRRRAVRLGRVHLRAGAVQAGRCDRHRALRNADLRRRRGQPHRRHAPRGVPHRLHGLERPRRVGTLVLDQRGRTARSTGPSPDTPSEAVCGTSSPTASTRPVSLWSSSGRRIRTPASTPSTPRRGPRSGASRRSTQMTVRRTSAPG